MHKVIRALGVAAVAVAAVCINSHLVGAGQDCSRIGMDTVAGSNSVVYCVPATLGIAFTDGAVGMVLPPDDFMRTCQLYRGDCTQETVLTVPQRDAIGGGDKRWRREITIRRGNPDAVPWLRAPQTLALSR